MIEKLKLPSVTLIAIAGNKQGETIAAIYKSIANIEFAAVKLITNTNISCTGIEVVNVGGLNTWEKYNHFVVKELHNHFDTDHCLIIQWDGFILNHKLWDNDFLNYDYAGAVWLDGRCGNGGFSLRSKKLMKILAEDNFISITAPEDEIICKLYGEYLKDKHSIKFAPKELCDNFSFELNEPLAPTFGFHGWHWPPFRETVVIKRSGALGDVIMCEPLLHYFHQKGYQVALDTQPQFMAVYFQHYFPVVPKSHLNPKLPYKEINLDMAYEVKPKQPVLLSYFEMAGVSDYKLRNSILDIRAGNNQKIFKKYVVIHIDDTDNMPYRDVHGVEWESVVEFLKKKGYQVFQIGRRVDKEIAPYLNTMNLEFMMFIIKGADLFIGSDSGCAQVAVGFDIPSVIFFGSVNPLLRYNNFDKIRVVQSECPLAEKKNCYHEQPGRTIGSDCVVDKKLPPCTIYSAEQIIDKIKKLI